MPGSVIAIHVADDEAVTARQPVATLEAMKMEHVVPATIAGRISGITVGRGDQVVRGQRLASIEP
jgi:biotin carboxyl carrier protein